MQCDFQDSVMCRRTEFEKLWAICEIEVNTVVFNVYGKLAP